MKKSKFLYTFLFSSLMFSCSKEDVKFEKKPITNDVSNITPIITSPFDWEGTNKITITDGSSKILPWYSSASTAIPPFILVDYKKEEGWELLYNLCNEPGESGQNYLIFYNKFSGILRTYYFLADNISLGTNGMWGITLDGNNSLLNNSAYFANPSNVKSSEPISISTNISNESLNKGITRGWNAFDTEFTYDPDLLNQVKMGILSYNKNIEDIQLDGDINLQSSGSIVTSSSKNSLQGAANSAVKSAGSAAKDYVKDKLTKANSKGNKVIQLGVSAAAAIVSGGVSEMVSAGINLLFGSFIGKKTTQTNTVQKLEFKTHGKLTLSGSITSNQSTNVTPVSNLLVPGTSNVGVYLIPNYNKKLGVWNLTQKPLVKAKNFARRGAIPMLAEHQVNSYDYSKLEYTRSVRVDPQSVQITVNPEILPLIEKYEVSTKLMFYEKFQGSNNWNSVGNTITNINNFSGNIVYDDDKTTLIDFSGNEKYYFKNLSGSIPPVANVYDTPLMINIQQLDNRYVVKVTVTIYPKAPYNSDPIVITRSYIPEIVIE